MPPVDPDLMHLFRHGRLPAASAAAPTASAAPTAKKLSPRVRAAFEQSAAQIALIKDPKARAAERRAWLKALSAAQGLAKTAKTAKAPERHPADPPPRDDLDELRGSAIMSPGSQALAQKIGADHVASTRARPGCSITATPGQVTYSAVSTEVQS